MGGHQVENRGTGDDGYDEDGYDESQRAEILEATRDGPSDGTILTDLDPDVADVEETDKDEEDDLEMEDGEVGEEDLEADETEADKDEDDAQEDFDSGTMAEGDDLPDKDDVATRP